VWRRVCIGCGKVGRGTTSRMESADGRKEKRQMVASIMKSIAIMWYVSHVCLSECVHARLQCLYVLWRNSALSSNPSFASHTMTLSR
jgi:hypothetical protein